MENVIGGKLKLKKPLQSNIKKKKKARKSEEGGSSSAAAGAPEADYDDDPLDTRTSYEKKWDEQIKKLDSKNAKVKAQQSHRDRINEFNDKLSKLSEHNDIPRVAGGA